MKVHLEHFIDETFPDFFAIYLEENGDESIFDPEMRERVAQSAIDPEHSIVRGIWDSESGVVLGYCEVQNIADPDWEIGVYILERYRFQGVGKTAMPLFLDELAAMGRHSFIVRILPENQASRKLFEGLGAELVSMEVLGGALSDGLLESEVLSKKEDSCPEELARLRVLEDLIRETKREVCVYRIDWPPAG